ncbi:adenine deaminase C-terminal domain-containing protein [Paenibacillus sp. GP183]|jgi:adenine deaminase|uniref:adenine deaminase C-terminal domain-containing protein n=1 Tax=Paenibacillus sp. GP183 TaxID=1882751 RepID=UPI00089C2984|nr:adenine deaminase C-terminal domain-containing protein [Paenibacillus sp. GP183]SEC13201.1 adenine deaminase [Paenibacillus sp. GP183]
MYVDTLILDVQVFNSALKKFYLGNVAVIDGRFFYIGDKATESFQAKEVLQGNKRFMIPGLIDIHLHIESTMVTPRTFSYGLIKNGVTTIVADPHEMANVFGLRGIQEMIAASEDCKADIWYAIPSSVPATDLETTGGTIDVAEIDALLLDEKVICLGEIMNFADLITNPEGKTNRLLMHMRTNYPKVPIEGHCPRLMDLDLSRFVFAGIDSDHTEQTVQGMEERIKAGMFIEIQEKSMTEDIINHLVANERSEHFCFVTDDVMPDTFKDYGHLNHLLRKAVRMGMKPEAAIYAGTFTPARRMNLNDRGRIAPDKIADFILLDDITEFSIGQVYKNGIKVYDANETYEQEKPTRQFPDDFYQSVQLKLLQKDDFSIPAPIEAGTQTCRVMMVSRKTTFTKEQTENVEVRQNELQWEESPYCCIGIFERYGKNGNRAFGLLGGDTIKRGAIATTYSHDNHNLLVVGKNKDDMLLAANTVIEHQGGFCVVENGKVISFLSLPVGGILTEAPLGEVADQMKHLRQSMLDLGYVHYNPIMSISTHSLPVSPELKITDLGLVRVNEGKLVSLFI